MSGIVVDELHQRNLDRSSKMKNLQPHQHHRQQQQRLFVGLLFVFGVIETSCAARCEKISTQMCSNVGYNLTSMPNFMHHTSQTEAIHGLTFYEPLLQRTCSAYIRLFICSIFVPLCSEHVPGPVPPCKGLCEKVRDDCLPSLEKSLLGFTWPTELDCTRFPESPALCIQQPSEDHNEIIPGSNIAPSEDLFYNFNQCPPDTKLSGSKCLPLCQLQQKEDVNRYEIWIAIWSIICLTHTIFSLLTFLIQPRRFRWPARPILYLTSCGFITSTIYLMRWIEGPYTCTGDSLLEKPSESLSCVCISLILLFCDIAYSLWWCVFCFVWFLSAMKEWSTEAIEKISTRLHASVWILSALPMLYILVSNNINLNYLSGFCEVKNVPLIMFQLAFLTLSIIFTVLTCVALRSVRKTLMAAGRCPNKLERLFYRLLILSVGICLPHVLYLLSQFYDTFAMALMKLVLRNVSIIFSTLWVFSPKTFQVWQNILSSPFKTKLQNDGGLVDKIVIVGMFPNVFKGGDGGGGKIGRSAVPLMPVAKV